MGAGEEDEELGAGRGVEPGLEVGAVGGLGPPLNTRGRG